MRPRTRAESSRCVRSVFRESAPLCACPTRPCCLIPVLRARGCGEGLCVRFVVGALGGLVHRGDPPAVAPLSLRLRHLARHCTTQSAVAPLGPTRALVLPACRGPKWCVRRVGPSARRPAAWPASTGIVALAWRARPGTVAPAGSEPGHDGPGGRAPVPPAGRGRTPPFARRTRPRSSPGPRSALIPVGASATTGS